ncbi:KTSC domain-containing protein [Phyllobacterium endophyticum]|uniref:KTSC domain-containing protein n=1 Tax=Phyllobacterium endophyticum TaxID=1149773 RepID=UPI0011C7AD85|nr:KTSC domain-containing protein [Phyllobacterium endophyticum]TXR48878.1 KTSC domain-containing protein [Phyllobacterium endophyticum]
MPSTVIQKTSYDEAARILSIWFVPSGNRYDYQDVPPEIHAGLRAAYSKGQYFNAVIRDRFRCRLVERRRHSIEADRGVAR